MIIDEKAVETFMKSQGFERISDYYDNSGCPAPYTGPTLQFYNPTTKIAVVVSAGEYNDQLILAEDYIIEVEEKWNVETGEKIYQGEIRVKEQPTDKLKCPKCTWDEIHNTVDPVTGECCICNRYYEIIVE